MAKKVTVTKETTARSIADAMRGLSGFGVVESIVSSVQNLYSGADIEAEDIAYFRTEVTRLNGYSDASARVRGAELGTMLSQYAVLPEAIAKWRGKDSKKPCAYSVGYALAKRLKAGDTPTKAAAFVKRNGTKGKGAEKTDPKDRDEAASIKSCKTHVKRILEHVNLNENFRARLLLLAQDFDMA